MIRINKFSDPARGGRKVEVRTLNRRTTVVQPAGLTEETTRENWRDIGTLLDPVRNHVKEQPTNKWKQRLIDAQRAGVQP